VAHSNGASAAAALLRGPSCEDLASVLNAEFSAVSALAGLRHDPPSRAEAKDGEATHAAGVSAPPERSDRERMATLPEINTKLTRSVFQSASALKSTLRERRKG
jgi:hypothetical protein